MHKKLKARHLVSLNTARIKLRSHHPRISEDLNELFQMLKTEIESPTKDLYKDDGYINIEE